MRTARLAITLVVIATSASLAGAQTPGGRPGGMPGMPGMPRGGGVGQPPQGGGVGGGMGRARGGQPGRRPQAAEQEGPGDPVMGMMMGAARPGIASMLLARSGELKLTDSQVTRLAAIARRSWERDEAMRASMDSMMNRMASGQPEDGTSMFTRMRTAPALAREQERTEVRDALAVLTIDQQADAWMRRGMGGGRRP